MTVTIAVPSAWVGGIIVLGFVTNRIGGATPGSVITFTVDGVATSPIGFNSVAFDTSAVNLAATGTQGFAVARFAIPAGGHTIVATGGVGGVAFDYLAAEATTSRPVLVGGITRTVGSTATVKTSILALNAATQAILTEFANPAMVYVDIDALLGGPTPNPALSADNTHPNDVGHALIADAMVTAWGQMSLPVHAYL